MLLNLHKKKWTDGLTLQQFDTHSKTNEQPSRSNEFELFFGRRSRRAHGFGFRLGQPLRSHNILASTWPCLTYTLDLGTWAHPQVCAQSSSVTNMVLFMDKQEMLNLAIKYNKAVQEEDELSPEKLAIANVGRQDAKKHLEEHVSNLMSSNIVQTLGTMLDTVVF
ncbi:hypothetical protein L1049_001613 [Liquidambar formosana]|uniref:26S proteasome regulatory subunit RPN11 C-terminal domain-containing protein n=1 Tax=Liquidambar formosana TaxID=63359 RepID=A0AAP0N718_LIQFO